MDVFVFGILVVPMISSRHQHRANKKPQLLVQQWHSRSFSLVLKSSSSSVSLHLCISLCMSVYVYISIWIRRAQSMCLSHILHAHIQFDVFDLFPICSHQQIPNNVISDVRCANHEIVRSLSSDFDLGHTITSWDKRKVALPRKWIRVFSGVSDPISINKPCLVYWVIVITSTRLLCNPPRPRGGCPVHHNGIRPRCMNHLLIRRGQWWANLDRSHRPMEQRNDRFRIWAIERQVNTSVVHLLAYLVLRLVGRSFGNHQVPAKLEFSTPVRSMTPEMYSRVPSSIKRSRMTPAMASSSTYETPPPPLPLPSAASNLDSAE